jgi:hypothetical protein
VFVDDPRFGREAAMDVDDDDLGEHGTPGFEDLFTLLPRCLAAFVIRRDEAGSPAV